LEKISFQKGIFYDQTSIWKINISEEAPLKIEYQLDYFSEQIVSLQMKIQRWIDARIFFGLLKN
jgi:hypothetical protein